MRIDAGRQRLHWQYVEEVAETIAHVIDHPLSGAGRTFNCHGVTSSYGEAGAVLGRLRPDISISHR